MIAPLTIDHALAIAPHLRESDRVEVSAIEGAIVDWQKWAQRLVDLIADRSGHALAGLVNGTPFVMGGFFEVPSPEGRTCGVWMVATPLINEPHGARIASRLVAQGHRAAREKFDRAITWSDTGNLDGNGMLKRLGYLPAGDPVTVGGRLFQQMGVRL